MVTRESTVFEKLFQDDHPMGGMGMATAVGADWDGAGAAKPADPRRNVESVANANIFASRKDF